MCLFFHSENSGPQGTLNRYKVYLAIKRSEKKCLKMPDSKFPF